MSKPSHYYPSLRAIHWLMPCTMMTDWDWSPRDGFTITKQRDWGRGWKLNLDVQNWTSTFWFCLDRQTRNTLIQKPSELQTSQNKPTASGGVQLAVVQQAARGVQNSLWIHNWRAPYRLMTPSSRPASPVLVIVPDNCSQIKGRASRPGLTLIHWDHTGEHMPPKTHRFQSGVRPIWDFFHPGFQCDSLSVTRIKSIAVNRNLFTKECDSLSAMKGCLPSVVPCVEMNKVQETSLWIQCLPSSISYFNGGSLRPERCAKNYLSIFGSKTG